MKNTSKKAFTKGQIEFWTHRNIITEAMKDGQKRTFREIAAKVILTEQQTWKRVSELETDGTLIDVGFKDFNGKSNTLYQFNFDGRKPTKQQSLLDWLKNEYPEILNKYKILVQHEL